jgi:hypothetical protein
MSFFRAKGIKKDCTLQKGYKIIGRGKKARVLRDPSYIPTPRPKKSFPEFNPARQSWHFLLVEQNSDDTY